MLLKSLSYSVFKVHISRFPALVGSSGLEPPTSRLSGARSSLLSYEPVSLSVLTAFASVVLSNDSGGDEEIRTLDPLLAGQVLSQLSYTPRGFVLSRTLKIEQRMTRNTLQLYFTACCE